MKGSGNKKTHGPRKNLCGPYALLLAVLNRIFRKQVIPCNIIQPFPALVMPEHPRPFHEFVRTQQEIDPHDGKLEHKGRNKAKGNGITPHIDGIAEKAEPAVPSRPENAGYQGGVDGGAHDIIGIDEQHIFQIMHGCFGKRSIFQHKGSDGKNQKAAQRAAYDSKLHEFFGVLFGILQPVFPDYLSQKNPARAGYAEAEDGTEVTDHDDKGVGGHRIGAKMADDDGISGKRHAPDNIIAQGRQGKPDKILEQQFVP